MDNKGYSDGGETNDVVEMTSMKKLDDNPDATDQNSTVDGSAHDAEQGISSTFDEKIPKPLCAKPYAGMGKNELLQFSQSPAWRAARWLCLLVIVAGWCAMLGFAIYLIVSTPRCLPWWKSAVVYQIFPRSFKDSMVSDPPEDNLLGGDGIGDLKGIIESVGYLQSLGINAVLLSSIYQSGTEEHESWDNGEDIVDFTDVDDVLGTVDDFTELVQALHGADIKLILDFIPNHSSIDHEFFIDLKELLDGDNTNNPDPNSQNYYTLADTPYNNWVSLYSDSAWECEYLADQKCFLHQYSEYQADFNLDNDKVKKELSDALETWFTRGVDGFNIRGVRYFYEPPVDPMHVYNEPDNPDFVGNASSLEQYDSLLHDYTAEYGDKSHGILRDWRDGVFYKFSTAGTYRVMLSDSNSNSTYVQNYYGTSSDPEADLPMNFNLLKLGDPEVNGGAVTGRDIEVLIKDWMDQMDTKNWPNFQLGNYAVSRIASRLGTDYTKVANILLLTLPGTPICYYGDEIGMMDITLDDIDQVKDLRALSDPEVWELKTRDPERSPMQWDSTLNAGFSENTTSIYLPVHTEYETVNVEDQTGDEHSALEMFRRMVAVRSKNRALTSNEMTFILSDENVVAYVRELDSEKSRFFIALNFGDEDSGPVDYYNTGDGKTVPLQGTVVVATEPDSEGSRVELNTLHLKPGEGVVVLLDEIVFVGSGWWYKFFTPNV